MFWDDLVADFLGESILETGRRSFQDFFLFPFRIIGACLVFTLDKGQRRFAVAYRFHAAKYYGLLLAGVVFLTWFFIRFIL